MKRVSSDHDYTLLIVREKPIEYEPDTNVNVAFELLLPGKYVACVYDNKWFVGNIVDRSIDNEDIYVDFMKQSSAGVLTWPTEARRDKCWIPLHHIICVIGAPKMQGRSARCYTLDPIDRERIQQKISDLL